MRPQTAHIFRQIAGTGVSIRRRRVFWLLEAVLFRPEPKVAYFSLAGIDLIHLKESHESNRFVHLAGR